MNNILRNLMLSTLLPLIILSGVSGGYLYKIVLSDKLSEINRINDIYEDILIEKSSNALATSDYPYFQKEIYSLIEKDNSGIISIELISIIDNKKIVASAPAVIAYSSPAVKIDIYGEKFTDDSFNLKSLEKYNIGYLLIRYNNDHIKQATQHVVLYFAALVGITILLMMAVYRIINKIVVHPYNEVKRNLISLKNDTPENANLNNFSGNEINNLIYDILDIKLDESNLIELMKGKINRLKNEINTVKFSKNEMVSELTHVLERKSILAHRLIIRLLDENTNDDLQHSYYLLSGTLDEITKTLDDSKKLIYNPYANYNPDVFGIDKIYESVIASATGNSYELFSAQNVKNDLLSAYVFLDIIQIQLLVEKLISIASQVSVRTNLYLNILIEEIFEDKLIISIEIKDSSNGMSHDDAENINRYLNDEQKEINTQYYSHEELKIIKNLKRVPGLLVSIYPSNSSGNYYRISLECDYSFDEKQLCMDNSRINTHVVKVQNDPENDLLSEHYRMMGIYISYVQFSEFKQRFEYVINQDVVVLEFSNDFDESISVFDCLAQHGCKVLAVVNESQIDETDKNYIVDKLFDKGITNTLVHPYAPERLKGAIEKTINFDENKIHNFMNDLGKI